MYLQSIYRKLHSNMKTIKQIIKEEFENAIYEKRGVEGVITKDENIGELLEHIYDKYSFDNTYISFRTKEHVTKINPNNTYNTPTGLYTYKLSNYIDKPIYNIEKFAKKFPYGSNRERLYFYVLKDDVNILDSDTDKSVLDGYVREIQKKHKDSEEINNLCERWFNNTYESYYSKSQHDTHKFWLFIYDVLAYLYENKLKIRDGFSKLCREIGVDGFDDNNCEGWIHPSEKCQTVFFRSNLFKDEFILKNEGYDNTEIDITQLSDEQIIKLINQNKLGDIYHFDDNIDGLINVLKRDVFIKNPKLIKHFLSQSQDTTEILLQYPEFLKYIKNDLDFLNYRQITKIINKHPKTIEYFKNIIDKINIDAIVDIIIENPNLISYFNKVLKKMNKDDIMTIIKTHPKTINFFKEYLDKLGQIEITNILVKEPELVKYFKDYLHVIGHNRLIYLLTQQPRLAKYFKDRIKNYSEFDIYKSLMKNPELISLFKDEIKKIDKDLVENLLGEHPQLKKYFKNK